MTHIYTTFVQLGKRSIKFKASELWNHLSTELKQIQSRNTFKHHLKVYFLDRPTKFKCYKMLIATKHIADNNFVF